MLHIEFCTTYELLYVTFCHTTICDMTTHYNLQPATYPTAYFSPRVLRLRPPAICCVTALSF